MESDKLSAVKLLACDVDGVLTDGSICYSTANAESRIFFIKDGLGMKLAGWAGLPVVWLTGRVSDSVAHRAAELNVQVFGCMEDKGCGLKMVACHCGVELAEIAFLGDDSERPPRAAYRRSSDGGCQLRAGSHRRRRVCDEEAGRTRRYPRSHRDDLQGAAPLG